MTTADTPAVRAASARQLRVAAAAQARARWIVVVSAAALWLGSMLFVLVGSAIGVAALQWGLGFTTGFFVATYATFVFFGRRAFPPHRRSLWLWVVAAVGLLGVSALSAVLAFGLVGVAEAALIWLAVSKEDWLPFDAAELIQTDACPKCGERRLHTGRICRKCGHAFDVPAQTT
jgi:hypothetical protein